MDDGAAARFVTVRFGNVLGSTGSVVPLFQRQLAQGGPLTVTHEDMRRYFMTVREAVELVLQASAMGSAAPRQAGAIYVLDMGEPVRIMDLARQMIQLAGLRPDRDVAIEVIGVRPGEKLFEELFQAGESALPTGCKGLLLAASAGAEDGGLRAATADLAAASERDDEAAAMALLRALVPGYRPDALEPPRAASA